MLLLIIILLLVFGGGGGYLRSGLQGGSIGLGSILLLLLVLYLLGVLPRSSD